MGEGEVDTDEGELAGIDDALCERRADVETEARADADTEAKWTPRWSYTRGDTLDRTNVNAWRKQLTIVSRDTFPQASTSNNNASYRVKLHLVL
ncbi:hypothetical protein FACS189472_16300 [Alphaproteobacteria bacterium]|nr:hypothetical protein FACS189472_16300 [Alphaproteobacteria bacterium]